MIQNILSRLPLGMGVLNFGPSLPLEPPGLPRRVRGHRGGRPLGRDRLFLAAHLRHPRRHPPRRGHSHQDGPRHRQHCK